ncbi:MAG: carboxypeptidase regulatory-like domain-containing protein [Bacteroidetes bacterium]|nr:carboxypeptidase regulatory-like domain-containing protein [Bacteroidota bacterium]
MIKKIYAVFLLTALTAGTAAFAQTGALKGKVIDETNGEGISFANVQLEQAGNAVAKTVADIDGNFTIKPIPPGKYNLKAVAVGYAPLQISGVIVGADKTTYQDLKVKTTMQEIKTFEVVEYTVPLIDPDTKQGGTVTREQFEAMPTHNVNSVASTTAGVFQSDEGAALSLRGSRQDDGGKPNNINPDGGATRYYIDGVPARGTAGLPESDIEQISVITGGIPAQYGDATGGIINITTRGGIRPEYYGGVEMKTSQLTDKFGENYVNFDVGGPIGAKKDSTGQVHPKLGFFFSGEVNSEKDPSPTAAGVYKVKDDKLKQLEEHPLITNPDATGAILAADYLTSDDLEHIKARQNVKSNSVRLGGKIDYKPMDNLTVTLGGSFDHGNYHDFVYEYSLLNPSHNPQVIYNNMRMYAKITHRLGKQHSKDDKTTALFQNAYYTLQVGYSKYNETEQSDAHKNNYFNYGYVGKFETDRKPVYTAVKDSAGNVKYYSQNTWADTAVKFTAGDLNPLAANYTTDYYSLMPAPKTIDDLYPIGMRNGDRPQSPYSLWHNTGRQYNGYHNLQRNQLRITGTFSTDIKNHAIQAGFDYEKRVDRAWYVNPTGLWTLGRQLMNKHLTQLDTFVKTLNHVDANGIPYYDHPYVNNSSAESTFGKNVRQSLGKQDNEWVDIDMLDPTQLNISMFSPDELLNNGNSYISYYGYSYDNKKLSNKQFNLDALKSFYKDTTSDGNHIRTIPAFQPVYVSGYIQDKFDIKDMKFNIGLRMDAFNANQPMLQDKYLLYEAYTVSEDSKFKHPSNMGSDYVVYVDDVKNPSKVVGYRNGDTWYDANGVLVTDPTLIAHQTTSGSIQPYLKYPGEKFLDSSSTDKVFKMYKTQVNLMPRIAFAFPISDRAQFFAHYDMLTQRPPANGQFSPTDYLFIQSGYFSTIGNPALKPEKTIDYELGFTQTLSERKNSALTLSAYYRQMKNMLQQRNVLDAYPVSYITYDNIDFGNVKGFTVKYDLRRTASSQLTASYTLQFAEATGSAASSASGVIAAGQPNLRSVYPADFDQRHAIVLNYDYRFGGGKDYRGPQAAWAKAVFENFGGNLIFRMGSGLPYSRLSNVVSGNGNNGTQVLLGLNQPSNLGGDINGSNMPWQYRVDLRLDKNIALKTKSSEDKASRYSLTAYVQILNLFNTKNILNVYRHTGDPADDGYLSYPGNQGVIQGYASPTSFVDLYRAKLPNPSNYSIPRRIRIGVVFNF